MKVIFSEVHCRFKVFVTSLMTNSMGYHHIGDMQPARKLPGQGKFAVGGVFSNIPPSHGGNALHTNIVLGSVIDLT